MSDALPYERWQRRAAQRKFEAMREFAAALPRLRREVGRVATIAARAAGDGRPSPRLHARIEREVLDLLT